MYILTYNLLLFCVIIPIFAIIDVDLSLLKDKSSQKPATSTVGKRQSPIDITTGKIVNRYEPLIWTGHNVDHPNMTFINDGEKINVEADWLRGLPPTIRGGPLRGHYKLDSAHWHWGSVNSRGGEHTFNGTTFATELHAVHYNSKYKNIEEAASVPGSEDPEALAVVGYLFKVVPDSIKVSPGIKALFNDLDSWISNGPACVPPKLRLSKSGLSFPGGFWSYQGSLTSPPFREIVRWIVSDVVLPIKNSQLEVLRRLRNERGEPLDDNYRDTQPLAGRVVKYYPRKYHQHHQKTPKHL